MYAAGNDSVIIVEDQKPIGILTTKDVVSLIKYKSDLNKPIKKYMNSPVESVHKRTSVREALEFVKLKHYKRLIVVDDEGRLNGIITQKELQYRFFSSLLSVSISICSLYFKYAFLIVCICRGLSPPYLPLVFT